MKPSSDRLFIVRFYALLQCFAKVSYIKAIFVVVRVGYMSMSVSIGPLISVSEPETLKFDEKIYIR